MSVLTTADYNAIRQSVYRKGQGKEELKAHATLPSQTALLAGFQALEDRWEATRASYKTNFDAAAGITTTAAEIRWLFNAWLANRRERGLQMTTFRVSVLGPTLVPDAGVFPDTIANQITEATAPGIGTQLCYVMADGGADEGLYGSFKVPKNYVGTPKLVVSGVLDGAPGAADTLGFGVRKRAVANNGAADATFDAEEVATATIGSNGLAYSDEDFLEMSITLTAGQYAVDNQVFYYVYIDSSGTTYAGNFLLLDVEFEYTDV